MRLVYSILLFILVLNVEASKIDSLKQLINSNKGSNVAELYLKLADAQLNVSVKDAQKTAKECINIAEQTNNSIVKIKSNRVLGTSFSLLNQKDSAFYYFYIALKIAEEIKDAKEIAFTKFGIASLYLSSNQLNKATNSFIELENVFIELNDSAMLALVYNNLGLSYQYSSKYDKSIKYFNKSLNIKLRFNETVNVAHTQSNLGISYGYLGEHEKALKYLMKALKTFLMNEDKYNSAIAYYNIADNYKDLNNFEQAETYIQRCISISKEINNNEILRNSNHMLYLIYNGINNSDKALLYYKKFKEYNDTIQNKIQENLYIKYQTKYETDKKEAEITVLNAQNKLKQKQLEHRSLILYIFIFGFVFILIIAIIFFYQKKKLNFAYQALLQKNIEISEVEDLIEEETQINYVVNKQKHEEKTDKNLLDKIQKDLETILNTEKVYREKDLTIFILADKLDTNKSYLSSIINERYNKNFNTFINYYRIKEARKLLVSTEYQHYTIAAISEKVGFKSISVFNKAFKDNTGLTPSYFLKASKKQQQ